MIGITRFTFFMGPPVNDLMTPAFLEAHISGVRFRKDFHVYYGDIQKARDIIVRKLDEMVKDVEYAEEAGQL